jgi:N-formylmaleamate deformylase
MHLLSSLMCMACILVGGACAASRPGALASAAFVQKTAPPRSFRASVTGTGRPVIMISDLQAAGSVWDETVAHLGPRVQAHTLNIAGFAGNTPIDAPLLRTLHAELAQYIQMEQLHKPILIGHMFGASVAFWLAMTHPDLVGGVIAIDGPPSRVTGEADDAAESVEIRAPLNLLRK